VGKRIDAGSGWGQALSAFASGLSPERVRTLPVPLAVLTDQVGGLLGLLGTEFGATVPAHRDDTLMRARIHDLIAQSSYDPNFRADDAAARLDIPPEVLHACLAGAGETFGTRLAQARTAVAQRMLSSPSLRGLSIAEIARRTGFADGRHLSRVMLARTGRTARAVREDAGLVTKGRLAR
jgi:AraC-like DNA-binding protein